MMSYLWILLLGSLLAASAKAQDDAALTEEVEDLDVDAAPDAMEESVTGEATEPQEIPASDPVTPAAEEAGPEPTPAADQEAEEEAATTPQEPAADPEPEEATPTPQEPAADPEPEEEAAATTPPGPAADPEPEEEAAATPPGPAADADVVDPTTEQTPAGEEEGEEEKGATPAPEESGVADPAVEDNEEKSPVPADVDKVDETNVFNLGDVPPEIAVKSKGRMVNAGTHVAGASGEDKPEPNKAGSGSVAAILSAVGVSVVGALVGYFTYQKKKLCFKNRQEADPEAARKADTTEAQSDPQVLSNLLNAQ